jgi:hypothetical protein
MTTNKIKRIDNKIPENIKVVAIGSTSEIKIRAVKKALTKCNSTASVVWGKTSSGVPEEPIGFQQVLTGAQNRAHQILEEKKADLLPKELSEWLRTNSTKLL